MEPQDTTINASPNITMTSTATGAYAAILQATYMLSQLVKELHIKYT